VKSVAGDVGRGLLEAPKAAVATGPRDALQSMLDGVKELGDWTNKYLPALQVTGEGAPRIVTPAEREANPNLPGSLAWISTSPYSSKTEAGFARHAVKTSCMSFHQGTVTGLFSNPEASTIGR